MAKAILDISINKGYPYLFGIDLNDVDGIDLETDYACYFECESIGQLQFSVVDNAYSLDITKENTDLLDTNLEEYVVYTVKTVGGTHDKLLSGRIIVDGKVRS